MHPKDNVLLSVGAICDGRQITAARALLRWSRKDLAQQAGLHFKTVTYWERQRSKGGLAGHAVDKIRASFARESVEFIAGEGIGVRLKRAL